MQVTVLSELNVHLPINVGECNHLIPTAIEQTGAGGFPGGEPLGKSLKRT